MLSEKNSHPRDSLIVFEEKGHTYTYLPPNNDSGKKAKFISVTTLIHHFFHPFNADNIIDKMMASPKWPDSKYFGQSKSQIKALWDSERDLASGLGTLMHKSIEDYFEHGSIPSKTTTEFSYFLSFWDEFKRVNPEFSPYRTEWIVYDEDKHLAGSIDFVLSNSDGDLVLLDWKRSKCINTTNRWQKGFGPFESLDDCNYIHYTIQLNSYRRILQTKYNKTVVAMFLVVLHPNQTSANVIPVDPIDDVIDSLWSKLPLSSSH